MKNIHLCNMLNIIECRKIIDGLHLEMFKFKKKELKNERLVIQVIKSIEKTQKCPEPENSLTL